MAGCWLFLSQQKPCSSTGEGREGQGLETEAALHPLCSKLIPPAFPVAAASLEGKKGGGEQITISAITQVGPVSSVTALPQITRETGSWFFEMKMKQVGEGPGTGGPRRTKLQVCPPPQPSLPASDCPRSTALLGQRPGPVGLWTGGKKPPQAWQATGRLVPKQFLSL